MVTRFLASLLLIEFAASPLLAQPPSDQEATKLLVGSWLVPRGQRLTQNGAITFRADGTFSGQGVVRIEDRDRPFEFTGKWRVTDGILVEEITSASDAQLIPIGWTTRDPLVAITQKEYRFRTEHGLERTYARR